MALSIPIPQIDARRIRSYLNRLPLCTRLLLVVLVAFLIAEVTVPTFAAATTLIPSKVALTSGTLCPGFRP